ncbi:hypothetical protein [Streptomyces sp. SID161]|uniref:hypothetical protein n=1 Tax=Streptomyces sp. SID161 TaxID=2690251 RepID=UPI00136875B0|nr:hypothetical protein [Streptomyces sp. SID161]MYW47917.1 hypothetical protein [Streptomyces sp. SID161]
MDAGLAAVLGATVGAAGTGGAGIVAALLARSQARSQLQAEHARIIREPRRAAYAGFAEVALKDHKQLSKAVNNLLVAAQTIPPHSREEFLTAAQQLYDSVQANENEQDHRFARVVVEGPQRVTDGAVEFRGAFADFSGQVLVCLLQSGGNDSCPPEELASLKEKRTVCYSSILRFLYSAQRALGADGIDQPLE